VRIDDFDVVLCRVCTHLERASAHSNKEPVKHGTIRERPKYSKKGLKMPM
jgi:hypothetical protein